MKSRKKQIKKISYSQCGEDLIVDFIMKAVKVKNISYLDIGTYDPIFINNTYLFYEKGFRGVCVEPNRKLYEAITRKRPEDTVLNAGISSESGEIDYYVMGSDTLNTFNREEAFRLEKEGVKIKDTLHVPCLNVNDVIKDNFNKCPAFISIDTEGLELPILKDFDFELYRPVVFCIETVSYSRNKKKQFKETETIDFLISKGYSVHADTYVNTIFIDKSRWA